MRTVPTMPCGDGRTRADTHSLGMVIAKTASYTIIEHEQQGRVFSNKGAAGAVTFTLPKPLGGRLFTFVKAVPAQNLLIQGTNGAKINNGTANKIYQNVTSEAGVCTLFADGTDWFVLSEKGTWANNNT